MLARLTNRGFGSRTVETLREARDLLGTFRWDVVLAAESLVDGRGYDLTEIVARRSGTLLVGVPLSESCLWLPVVERGALVLGRRALKPSPNSGMPLWQDRLFIALAKQAASAPDFFAIPSDRVVELGAQIELAGPAVTGYQCEGQAGESEVASPEV